MDDAEALEAWLGTRTLFEQAFYIYASALAIGILIELALRDQGDV